MHLYALLLAAALINAELIPRADSSNTSTPSSVQATTTTSTKVDSTSKQVASSSSLLQTSTKSSTTKTASSTSAPPTTSTKADTTGCPSCRIDPVSGTAFEWPQAVLETITAATIIHRINTIDNVTQTITSYATVTTAVNGQNDADGWNSALSTTGITMKDGTPVLTKTFSIWTATDKYFTSLVTLQSPASYLNYGWVIASAKSTQTAVSDTDCAVSGTITTALTPTAPLPGETALYQGELFFDPWLALVNTQLGLDCVFTTPAPASAVQLQTALTATSTEYDDNVHTQSSTKASAAADSTKTSGTKVDATTKEATGSTKDTATTKQAATSAKDTSAAQPTQSSQPADSRPATQATTQANTQNSSPSASPVSQTITRVDTVATTSTGTLTPVVIGSSTILPGSTAVVSGTTYAVQVTTAGSSIVTNLVANGQILTSTSTAGLGSIIYEGLGGTVTASAGQATVTTGTGVATMTSVEVTTFTGAANEDIINKRVLGFGVMIGLGWFF